MRKSPKGSMSTLSWITKPPTKPPGSRRGSLDGRSIKSTSRRLQRYGSIRSDSGFAGLPNSPESSSDEVFTPLQATRSRHPFIHRSAQSKSQAI
jgi:hypothetical protein